MPHPTDSRYSTIQVTQLAPTIGAEISGVDFSKAVDPEVFSEVKHALTTVRNITRPQMKS